MMNLATLRTAMSRQKQSHHVFKSLSSKASPSDYDVVIVGGGAVGANVAYHLALLDSKMSICVIERDYQYLHASTTLSAAGIRQQFSLPTNIELSKYGIDFIKNAGVNLKVEGEDPPDLQFKEQGYLFLATEQSVDTLKKNHETQKSCGVDWMSLLGPNELKAKFPWLNTDDVILGSFGEKNEGFFDPWAMLSSVNRKAKSMGVSYLTGHVCELKCSSNNTDKKQGTSSTSATTRIDKVVFRDANDNLVEVGAGVVVNAAGAFAQQIAALCGDHVTKVPVEARKRSVFHVHCSQPLAQEALVAPVPGYKTTPLVVCPGTGAWFRPEGGDNYFICGVSPSEEDDVNGSSYHDLDQGADFSLFENIVWPSLYERCEAFESLKVKSSWVGFYEYNTLDQNAIIGYHSDVSNMMLCNGFSGHGLQQSMAAGRAVAEMIKYNKSTSIDVDCFSFDRVLKNEPLYEENIV